MMKLKITLLFMLLTITCAQATEARLERFYWDCHEKNNMRIEIILDGNMTVFYADCNSDFRAVIESRGGVQCQAYSPMCSNRSTTNAYLYLTCDDQANDTIYIPCPTDANGHIPPRH